ncbi:NAD(P)/FAD-dependent oxidoreductase [Actinomadura sp. KC345]|nr:NAD(P)/FAD-dependent oxidoreductase [Actinomadura sp. KC345]
MSDPMILPDETRLRAAIADANVPTLLMVLVQLTGDLQWLEPPYQPTRPRGLDDNSTGGLSERDQTAVREAAVRAILRWHDGAPPALPMPDRELMSRMMQVSVSEPVPPEYGLLLVDELSPPGVEPAPEAPGFSVAVIGAGVSGLLAAVRLREVGISCTVFERDDDIGGTWYYNGYPGAGVDTPSYIYSYSFFPWDWKTHFGRRDDVLEYLRAMADDCGLSPCIELRTTVSSAVYDAAAQGWSVTTVRDDVSRTRRFDAVISAVGQLNVPSIPDLPGLADFRGPVFHSSQWPADLDVTGKRVAVIGTGASAMQIVPAIASRTSHLTVFQRSPHWIAPSADYFGEVRPTVHFLMAHVPYYRAWYRWRLGWIFNDKTHASLQIDPEWPHPERALNAVNDRHRAHFTNYLHQQLAGRPDLQAKALPNYPPFGKRMLLDNGWYTAIRRDDVSLETSRAVALTSSGVRAASGTEHPADVVVLATGFESLKLVQTVEIRGRSGQTLRELWGDDDGWAYLGVTTPDFPNLFFLYGPGTSAGAGGSYIFLAECQVNYVVSLLDTMRSRGLAVAEVRREISDAYKTKLDAAHAKMVWTHPGVSNYYRNEKGRVVTNSPWRFIDYWQMTRSPDLADFETEPAGEEKSPRSRQG